MNLYEQYEALKEKEKEIKEEILDIQCKLYEKHQTKLNEKEEGTVNVSDPAAGYTLKVTKRMSYKVDQKKAASLGFGFSVKYGFSKTIFDKLSHEQQLQANGCVTTTPAKPSFVVEKL